MTPCSRAALSVLTSTILASAAGAVEVTLELSSVVIRRCQNDHGLEVCDPVGERASVSGPAPRGVGVVDLDAAGVLIRGTLGLEEFSVNGLNFPALRAEIDFSNDQLSLIDPASGWPISGRGTTWSFDVSRFEGQADFSGAFFLQSYEGDVEDLDAPEYGEFVRRFELRLSVTSAPGSVPVMCAGERLFLDEDGDGKVSGRDAWSGGPDVRFGDAIDSEGRTPLEFCSIEGQSPGSGRPNRSCARLDYGNDEPLRRRPGDCHPAATAGLKHRSCQPAEFFYRSQPPAVASRFCEGYGVVDDADGDGEPDATDLCANTPTGSAIDGRGCDAAQFCSQQSVQSCQRADFLNDEPLVKKPGDCARTSSQPRACAAAN